MKVQVVFGRDVAMKLCRLFEVDQFLRDEAVREVCHVVLKSPHRMNVRSGDVKGWSALLMMC